MSREVIPSAARPSPFSQHPPRPSSDLGFLDAVLHGSNLFRAFTRDERKALEERQNELGPWLRPATSNQMIDVLTQCFMGFGGAPMSKEDAREIATQYILVLKGLPLWAVARAAHRFSSGDVRPEEVGAKRLDLGYKPSTAQLRSVAHDIAELTDREFQKIRTALRLPPPAAAESPEERERGLSMIEAWRARRGIGMPTPSAPAPGYSERVKADLAARARDRILREYAANRLPVPADQDNLVSLSMLLSMGCTIVQLPDGSCELSYPKHAPPLNRTLGLG